MRRKLLSNVVIFISPLHTLSQDLDLSSLLCITGGSRIDNNQISAANFGIEHNIALEAAHDQIVDQMPVDMESYLELLKDQAQQICDGEGECLATIDNYANHAVNYAIQDQTNLNGTHDNKPSNSSRIDGRRLVDILPENSFSLEATSFFEKILSIVSLDEEEIFNALQDLHSEITAIEDEKYLPNHEKFFLEGAISVARASTSYWHKAYRDESNRFRKLSRSKNVFDCMIGGRYKKREEHSHRRKKKRRTLRGNSQTSVFSEKPQTSSTLSRQNLKGKRSLYAKSKKKKKYEKYGHYAHVEHHKHYAFRPSAYEDDDYWHKEGYKHSKDYTDDWYYYYYYDYHHDDKYKYAPPSPAKAIGTFAVNVAYVIRADIIGVLVGAIIGRGCIVPSIASSFLFSAIYAMCYRRVP